MADIYLGEMHLCAACGKDEKVDENWVGLRISAIGELIIEHFPCNSGYEDVCIFACGQLTALVLIERWLHTGSCAPPTQHTELAAPNAFEPLT